MLFDQDVVGLLPLVPFCQGGGTLQTIERAAERVKARVSEADALELDTLLAIFGARFVGNAPMLAMIRRFFMSTEILETSPLYHELMRKATEHGMAQGIEQGAEQGMAQGMREAVLAVLRDRFGELAPELVAAINSAGVGQLRALLTHAGTEPLEQLAARLD